ncbi:alpha/beta fold hydrolase [Streptomyces sp. IF17]|nr:alpha/beta fold hydrolase [Streptomyces alkaliphilus]
MARRIEVAGRDGLRLVVRDFSARAERPGDSSRPAVLMLHGLMGRASHWAGAARRLEDRFRVFGLDQRGHGLSDKPVTGPYDRDAFVADLEAVIHRLELAPVILIGHAMGALTAWQLAARRPDLVRALVICDMRASALGERAQRDWEEWYASWPLPFGSRAAARRWFAEQDPRLERPSATRGDYYAEVMVERADGWRPVFSRRQMLMARESWIHDAHWEELARVRCPSLVLRGVDGELGRAEAQEMVRVLARGRYADIPDAGHLAHLDRPDAWQEVVDGFLEDVLREDLPREEASRGEVAPEGRDTPEKAPGPGAANDGTPGVPAPTGAHRAGRRAGARSTPRGSGP